MLKFHPYSILTEETMVGFVIYCVLSSFCLYSSRRFVSFFVRSKKFLTKYLVRKIRLSILHFHKKLPKYGFFFVEFVVICCLSRQCDVINNKSHGLSPPGGFSSLLFDQAVPYYSQRHLPHLHFASIILCQASWM